MTSVKAVTVTRIAALVQAIFQLRKLGKRITQVQLALLSGLSEKMVRRLHYAALVAVENAQRKAGARRPSLRVGVPVGGVLGLSEPMLESQTGLPPPVVLGKARN